MILVYLLLQRCLTSASTIYGSTSSNQFTEISDVIILSEKTESGEKIYDLKNIIENKKPKAQIFSSIDAFHYDQPNGAILLTKSLDRENVCKFRQENCFITLKVLIQMSSISQKLLTLTVNLQDVNDQSPEFEIDFSGTTFHICYDALKNGINADIFLAKDQDKNSNLEYTLKSNLGFKLEEESGGHLVLQGAGDALPSSLDGIQQMVISVTDGIQQTELPLQIKVDDQCTRKYQFTQKLFQTTIEENVRSQRTDIILGSTAPSDQVKYFSTWLHHLKAIGNG
jgi:hypothetical protein